MLIGQFKQANIDHWLTRLVRIKLLSVKKETTVGVTKVDTTLLFFVFHTASFNVLSSKF